ncbi:hypothetical protein C8D87_102841 [Lentzea atacamensis]|uniref:Secreted protein n=1 Tax=Lentzea atacamensis TaxID=531938 RepID=A0ABX9EH69_9PSEU|nr:hypothetical protein C8D87_102841 [Lentzea atacamensis]
MRPLLPWREGLLRWMPLAGRRTLLRMLVPWREGLLGRVAVAGRELLRVLSPLLLLVLHDDHDHQHDRDESEDEQGDQQLGRSELHD